MPSPTRMKPVRQTRAPLPPPLSLLPPLSAAHRTLPEHPYLQDLEDEFLEGGADIPIFHMNDNILGNGDHDVPMFHINDNIMDSQEHNMNGCVSSYEEEESYDNKESSDNEVCNINGLG